MRWNWRKPVIEFLLNVTGSKILNHLEYMRWLDRQSLEVIKKHQRFKLKALLKHASRCVPYYHKLLPKVGVVRSDSSIDLDKFHQIPPLTKEIIREVGPLLYSCDHKKRGSYENTSGGSTGEPVKFLQDRRYDEWNIANKLFFNMLHGKQPGDPELKLWGSDRDILEGTLGLKDNIINFLYNRSFLNTFDLSKQNFSVYVNHINKHRPTAIWAYYDSMYELARYVNQEKKAIHQPKVIITTSGKLTDGMFAEIKRAFPSSIVVDQYGSREVGVLSIEKQERNKQSLFPWSHRVEVVDKHNQPIFEQEGKILVTALENYSMPLIRYQIEDLGVMADLRKSRGFFLQEVIGRKFAHFHKENGDLVHAQFFVTLMFDKPWVKKFKFLQRDYNDILLTIEKEGQENRKDIAEIRKKVELVMGEQCKLKIQIVKKLKRSKSGKYVYTESRI